MQKLVLLFIRCGEVGRSYFFMSRVGRSEFEWNVYIQQCSVKHPNRGLTFENSPRLRNTPGILFF